MRSQWEIYDLMLDYSSTDKAVEEVLIGVNWTLCHAGGMGLSRTLADRHWKRDWTGDLVRRPLCELAGWIRKWDRQHAAIGMASLNAALNSRTDLLDDAETLIKGRDAVGAIFQWFHPRMRGQRVMVVGEGDPGFPWDDAGLHFLPTHAGALSPRCEQQVSAAQWLFISDDCIADKTLPRLLELASDAKVVLFGAGVPWLREFREFGVDYLAGAQIDKAKELRLAIAEGAEPELVNGAIHYRITALDKAVPCYSDRRVAAG